jgi:hypothetical protein
MRNGQLLCVILGTLLASTSAMATPILLAAGTLTGSAAGANQDLSGLTGALENGLPGNILGGLGSGLAYAGGNTFLSVPDRGPNATPYNSAVDDTVSYISRFQTLSMTLTPSGGALPFTLGVNLDATTLLYSPTPLVYGTGAGLGNKIDGVTPIGSGAPAQNTASSFYFTGRSDNFDPTKSSGNAADARFDPESIRVAPDGKSVFVSDEYGPYVYQFDRQTGARIKSFTLPADLDIANLSPVGANEISGNTSGRTSNKGMEGLAITPDGKTLVGIMQAAVLQDASKSASKKLLRIVTVDVATGTTHEYGYLLTAGSGVSDIVAINDHEFLIDERDGAGLGDGSSASVKQVFRIDLTGAADITGLSGAAAAAKAVGKTLVLDAVSVLNANGIASTQIPSKLEGLALGPDVMLNGTLEHTLFFSNDNDFLPGLDGPNSFFVFGLTDADLPGFQQEVFVPEAPSLAVFGAGFLGLIGFGLLRRRTTYNRSRNI